MDKRLSSLGLAAGVLAFTVAVGQPLLSGRATSESAAAATATGDQSDQALQSEYEAFMQWMQDNHPDVRLGADALTSSYYRQYAMTLPGTLVGTDKGMVDAATGQVVTPADATYRIGNEFKPDPSWVQACREHHVDGQVDPGKCGLWLAMADGNFRPSGGYPWGDFTSYTEAQISSAVDAAGYRWDGNQ
jgi:hypothetical protein